MNRRTIRTGTSYAEIKQGFSWQIPADFNMASACCDFWADHDPDRRALTHIHANGQSEDWSFGALRRAVDHLASAMREAGIDTGDRIAIFLPQSPEVLVAHFAAWKLGAITLPLFTLFGVDAIAFRLADSGTKLVITDPENAPKIESARKDLPEIQALWLTGPDQPDETSVAAKMAGGLTFDETPAAGADDPAVLIYTSGTTGPPKGALHAHRFLLGHLPSVELHHPGIGEPNDVGWTPADWAWIGGLMDLAMPCLYFGVPVISRRFEKFTADAAFALMRDQRVTRTFLPPTALRLLRQSDIPDGLVLKSVGSGGESLGADLLDWGQDQLGVPINEFYGQTECNLVLTMSAATMEVRPGTMGQAVPGHDVAIIGSDGDVLPPVKLVKLPFDDRIQLCS